MFTELIPVLSGMIGATFDMLLKSLVGKNKSFSSATYLLLIYFTVTIFALPLILTHTSLPTIVLPWIALLAAIACYVFSNYSIIVAFKHEEFSNIAIVTKITFVLTFIFGIIFFNEQITPTKILGMGIIFLGILVIFFEKEKFQFIHVKGLVFALFNGIGYSIAGVFSKYALSYFTPYSYIFFIYLGLGISYLFFPNAKTEAKVLLPKVKYLLPVLGLLGILSYLTNLVSLKYFDLSFTYIVIGAVGVGTSIVYGIILFKERNKLLHKLIGLICILAGIFLLYS